MKTILTGVQPSGQVHIGNYFGAMKPSLEASSQADVQGLLFLADYHALNSVRDPATLSEVIYDLAASWLACGLDPEKTLIYRQSQIPEVFELQWILSTLAPKGLLNRAHAYKAVVAKNTEAGKKDLDDGVKMGIFNYPILMAADILLFSANEVPVGEDQTQHLEIARDLAEKFNRAYGEILTLPQPKIQKITIPGIDGRKMSKSYGNTLPIFLEPKALRKKVMKIVTDSSEPDEPKDPKDSLLFDYYCYFADETQIKDLEERYRKGVAWGHVKQELFEQIEAHFKEPREKYQALLADPEELDRILNDGAKRARELAAPLMGQVREAIGMRRKS